MANLLANETSPYLLQHADNPVDWRPWGEEAMAEAREREVPILLSIGYSACHWCHVMEHESFDDPELAAYLNENFVAVKVDREERPDVDAIYMEAVQGMTGHGGWPLNAFLTPDGEPFYGGTYFPPAQRQGMPSFRMVLEAVTASWQQKREQITAAGARVREQLGAVARAQPREAGPTAEELEAATQALVGAADERHGGFGTAPKFPPAGAIELLFARGEDDVAAAALDGMACGGIRDHLGGGFARYSVDERWLVPHFEKMLYDNALLARAYLHGWQQLGNRRWLDAATETLDWALREMRGPEGAFFSALDADSEGEEGRFYVWTTDELRETLAEAGLEALAPAVAAHFGVSQRGNFEGRNVLHLPAGPAAAEGAELPDGLDRASLAEATAVLLAARDQRLRPALDDKRICSWNALMISALADAGAVLDRRDYLDGARAAAGFVLHEMRGEDGSLMRTWKDGRARIGGFLEDHAYTIDALLDLYEATFEQRWYEAAVELAEIAIELFADRERGGFFTTREGAADVITRRKDVEDHPIPSGNNAMAMAMTRLGALSGEHGYVELAEGVLRLFGQAAARHPQALAHLLRVAHMHAEGMSEVALVAPARPGRDVLEESHEQALHHGLGELERAFRARNRPLHVLAGGPEGTEVPPLMRERTAREGRPTAYVCEGFSCREPVTEAAQLAAQLGDV